MKLMSSVALLATVVLAVPALAQQPSAAGAPAAVAASAAKPSATKKLLSTLFGKKPAATASSAPAMAAPQPARVTTPVAPAAKAVAAGGNLTQVWVNTDSKVYHCPGSFHYGKTRQGTYMTESAAVAGGNRPDHGKVCH